MHSNCKRENLESIVKNSSSQREILEKIGLRAAGGNFSMLKKYTDLYNIDLSHYRKKWEVMVNLQKAKKIPTGKILVENSSYSRSHLKIRLYKEGLKKRECELCGQDENWKGKKMALILDHKNGIYNDNRIDNLRIVCPNCNATLPTHCGKNLFTKVKIPKCPNYKKIKEELKKETKFQLLKKYGNTHTIRKRLNDLEKLELVKKSNINFSKFGWVTEASEILGVKLNVGGRWIKEKDPEFYDKCFKRK